MGNTCCENVYNIKTDNLEFTRDQQLPLFNAEERPPVVTELSHLVAEMQQQIKEGPVYDSLISRDHALEWLQKINQNHMSPQQINLLLNVILQYMQLSKENANQDKDTEPNNYETVVKGWAQIANKVDSEVTNFYKESLGLLDYICPLQHPTKYDHCFSQLRFDMKVKEVQRVARTVLEVCRTDRRAFSFLTNYLVVSCLNLEKKGVQILQIEEMYLQVLKTLSMQYPIFKQTQSNIGLLYQHTDWKSQQELTLSSISLKGASLTEIDAMVQSFIMEQAKKAVQNYDILQKYFRPVLMKHGGIKYEQTIRIAQKYHEEEMLMIKQKLMPATYLATDLNHYVSELAKDGKKASFERLLAFQQRHQKERLREEFQNSVEPIKFTIKDMLRIRCLFPGIDKINSCYDELKQFIDKEEKFKLIQLENRLRGDTPSASIIARVLVGQTLAEVELVNEHQGFQAYFSHHLDWLSLGSSQLYSPFAALFTLNQKLNLSFHRDMNRVIQKAKESQVIPKQRLQNMEQSFSKLIKMTNISSVLNKNCHDQFNFLIDKKIVKFTKVKNTQCKNPSKNQTLYFWSNQAYSFARRKSEKLLLGLEEMIRSYVVRHGQSSQQRQQYERELRAISEHFDMFKEKKNQYMGRYLNWIGRVHEKKEPHIALKAYEAAEIIYQQSSQEEELIMVLNRKAHLYGELKQYEEAINIFQKILIIQGRVSGKESYQYFSVMKDIGTAYHQDHKYSHAQKYYEQSLAGLQKTKGYNCHEVGSLYASLGATYSSQSKYSHAHDCLNWSVGVYQRVKGRESLDVAGVLKNIGLLYHNEGKAEKALTYLQQSIEIRERIKGKDSLQSADILGVVGLILAANKRHEQAIKSYLQCLSIHQKVKNRPTRDRVTVLKNLSASYLALGQEEQAEKYLKKSQQMASKCKR